MLANGRGGGDEFRDSSLPCLEEGVRGKRPNAGDCVADPRIVPADPSNLAEYRDTWVGTRAFAEKERLSIENGQPACRRRRRPCSEQRKHVRRARGRPKWTMEPPAFLATPTVVGRTATSISTSSSRCPSLERRRGPAPSANRVRRRRRATSRREHRGRPRATPRFRTRRRPPSSPSRKSALRGWTDPATASCRLSGVRRGGELQPGNPAARDVLLHPQPCSPARHDHRRSERG